MTSVAGILLAAGLSRRMGAANKLTAPYGDKPLVRHAGETLAASTATPVIVVTGHDRKGVIACLAGLDFKEAHNADFATGMASSLRTGIDALAADIDAAVIMLGDMPALKAHDIDALVAAFAANPQAPAVAPVHAGRRGNPVLWSRTMFGDLRRLRGDRGARGLLGTLGERLVSVEVGHAGIFRDVDTAADFASGA